MTPAGESEDKVLFYEPGASWYWLLGGPLSAASLIYIEWTNHVQISLLVPVTDRGKPHMVAIWGGSGFNFPHTPPRFKAYSDSAERFERLALAAGADVPLANHTPGDTARKTARFMARGPNDPNPYLFGQAGVRRFFETFSECALAYGAQMNPPAKS